MTPEALARLHAAASSPERPWSVAEFASLLTAPGALLLGDARAMLLARVTLDEAEVLTLATDPAYRRQGLARALLHAFHADATRRGAGRAFLEVAEDNDRALPLYLNAGYVPVGRRPAYYPRVGVGPAAALVLSRSLP